MPLVESSAIERVDYNSTQRLLFVTFASGRRYVYFDVRESVFHAFLASPSQGQFFNQEIRDHYHFRKLG
jgi:hypothetical protein